MVSKPSQPASSVVRVRCAGDGSTTPTRLTPGRPLSTRAWLLPITPAPMTPTRKPALAGTDTLELIRANPDSTQIPGPLLARTPHLWRMPAFLTGHDLIQKVTRSR